MTDLLLCISVIALFAYGFWLMTRLDCFVFHMENRHNVRASHWGTMLKMPSFVGRRRR